MASKPTTRESNKSFKAARIQNQYNRRSTADVQAEKKAKAAAKNAERAVQSAGAAEVAQIEHDARQKLAARKSNPGKVFQEILPPKKPRKRAGDEVIESGEHEAQPSKKTRRIKKVIYEEETEDESESMDVDDELSDPQHKAIMKELESDPASDDEYTAAHAEADAESESSSNSDDVELDDEEPDTAIEWKKGKKGKEGKNKKGAVTDHIRSLRDELSNSARASLEASEVNSAGSKTKGSKGKSASKQSKSTKGYEGLKSNWNDDVFLLPNSKHRASAASSGRSSSPLPPTSDAEDEGLAQQPGGFGDDDDEIEHQALLTSSYKLKSIVKTEPIDNATTIFKKVSKAAAKRPKVGSLPPAARAHWRAFKIVIINTVGQLAPWSDVTDEKVEEKWNEVVGDSEDILVSRRAAQTPAHELFQKVKALTKNQVVATEWKNRFAQAAVDAVAKEWDRRELHTPAERKEWVERMLGPDPRNRSSRDRPFLWRATDSLEWKGDDPNQSGGGLFLGRMVLKVFAEHLSIIGVPSDPLTPSKRPQGALMMTIQAINRALEYSLSGKTLIPLGNDKTGHFSEENWGDYEQITTRDGKDYRKRVKRATVFAKTIESLNDERWKAIIDSAAVYIGKKDPERVYDRARVNTVPILEEDDSDGDIIRDAMFDHDAPPGRSEPHTSNETPQTSTSGSGAVLHPNSTAE